MSKRNKKGDDACAQSIVNGKNTFRQDTIGHFEVLIVTTDDQPVPQADGWPTIEAVYINPTTRMMTTAIPQSQMYFVEPGRYYFDWRVPMDQPLLVHQVIYRAQIDGDEVIGEDIFTVLPIIPNCVFTPSVLTTLKMQCRCRK